MDKKRQLVLNSIQTPDGTILTSYHKHDFVTYKDKNGKLYGIDGGLSYLRRIGDWSDCKEMSVYSDDDYELVRKSFHRGTKGKNSAQPFRWIPMSEMSNDHLKNCIKYNEELESMSLIFYNFANELYQKELMYREQKGISIEDKI